MFSRLAAIALDSTGNIYVTGATLSNDFPVTPGAYQNNNHRTDKNSQYILITGDAFVTKIDPTGAKLVYSTYLGGSRDEMGLAIAVDANGAAYVTGFTSSLNFPTTAGPYSRTYKGPPKTSEILNFMSGDVFVTKLNPIGSQLVFATLIGGVNDDGGTGIALDPMGNVYVSGFTNSGEFPTTSDALQRTFPGMVYVEPPDLTKVFAAPAPIGHGFLLKMPPDGSSILYSTFLGGTGNNRGATRVVLDNAGNGYLTGLTGSASFPVTPNAMQRVFGGMIGLNDPKGDAWVAKISGLFPPGTPPPPVIPPVTVSTIANAASYAQGAVAPGEIIVVSGSGLGPAAQIVGTPDPATGLFATSVGGTRVLFDNVAAPIVNTSATQVTAIVPYEIDGKTSTQMQVSFNGQPSAATTLTVTPSLPGLFSADSSGAGQALASNADSSPNSAANPAGKLDSAFAGLVNRPESPGATQAQSPIAPVTWSMLVAITITSSSGPAPLQVTVAPLARSIASV